MTTLKDTIKITGHLHIERRNAAGDLVEVRDLPNLVVTAGKNHIAARMVGTPTAMSHMALGSGTTPPAVGDTALGTELGRVALGSAGNAGNINTYSAVFGAGVATGAVTEAGIFNDVSAGTMLNRATFPVLNKAAGDTVTVTWTVTIS